MYGTDISPVKISVNHLSQKKTEDLQSSVFFNI